MKEKISKLVNVYKKYGFIGFAGFSIISCGFILHNKSNKKKKRRQNK